MMYGNVTPVIRPALGGTVPLWSRFQATCPVVPSKKKFCILTQKNGHDLNGRHKSFQIQVHRSKTVSSIFFLLQKIPLGWGSWVPTRLLFNMALKYQKWKNKFVVCFVAPCSEAGNPFHGLRHSLIETSRRPVSAASIALTGRITEWA